MRNQRGRAAARRRRRHRLPGLRHGRRQHRQWRAGSTPTAKRVDLATLTGAVVRRRHAWRSPSTTGWSLGAASSQAVSFDPVRVRRLLASRESARHAACSSEPACVLPEPSISGFATAAGARRRMRHRFDRTGRLHARARLPTIAAGTTASGALTIDSGATVVATLNPSPAIMKHQIHAGAGGQGATAATSKIAPPPNVQRRRERGLEAAPRSGRPPRCRTAPPPTC